MRFLGDAFPRLVRELVATFGHASKDLIVSLTVEWRPTTQEDEHDHST